MKTTIELPLLPLRDVVVYPHMVIPLFVGREKSIEALEAAMTGDKQILLLAQRNPADDDPGEDALYRVGTIATVLQLLKLPDGTVKVLVEGEQRGTVERFSEAIQSFWNQTHYIYFESIQRKHEIVEQFRWRFWLLCGQRVKGRG